MRDTNSQDQEVWRLDKKVPITIIFALFVQFCGGLWYVNRLDARIGLLERDQAVQHDRDERQDRAYTETFAQLRDVIHDINNKLDRLIERGAERDAARAALRK